MIQFVTSATGSKHRAFAEQLEASFVRWGWPSLTVISDSPVQARTNVLASDDIGFGRGLKTRFGEFVSGHGPVCYVDADCEAVGPFCGLPQLLPASVAGVVTGVLDPQLPEEERAFLEEAGLHLNIASAFLVCDSGETARRVSEAWHRELTNSPWRGSDEWALNRVLHRFIPSHRIARPVDIGAEFREPMRNLIHHAAGGGQMPLQG